MTAIALVAMAAAAALIRLGWGGTRRAAAAGWAIGGVALACLTWRDGVWGLSVGLVAGSLAALTMVFQAGAVSPRRPGRGRSPRAVAVAATDHALGRRIAVFLAVVPLSFAAAQLLALAVTGAMTGTAPLAANSVATALFVQPTVWTALMAWQMMLSSPARMLAPPALVAGLGALIWLLA